MWVKYSDQYEISSDGHIRNSKTKRVLREFLGTDGYLRTQFDGKTRLVHRVVASVFLENPSNLPEVNHIDGNKTKGRGVIFMGKYIVAVCVPTSADAVRELEELTKVHRIGIIRAMKRGTPTLETEKGVVQFYSKNQVERHALFGRKFSKLFNFPIKYHADMVDREMDHTEFHGSSRDYILEKEKE